MEKRIIERFSLLKDKKVLIACSTGVDSMVLLDMAVKLLDNRHIGIIHIHHNRRIESDQEEKFIKAYAKEKNIPFYFKKLEKYDGSNFQAWAREQRYNFFIETAKNNGYDYVLLAHHIDDNFETILMRLLKSSSLKGYAGIDELILYQGISIYRPLLPFSKEEIKKYALEHQITYFEDDSNNHDDYKRNRIRHNIIPSLKEENPNWVDAINNYANTLKNASRIIENELQSFLSKKVKEYSFIHLFIKEFELSDFLDLDCFIKEQLLFRITKTETLSKRTINELIKQLTSSKDKIINHISNNLLLVKEYGKIMFVFGNIPNYEITKTINEDGTYHLMNNCQIIVNNNICEFKIDDFQDSYQIKNLPITIRTKKEGDKISLKTGTITISDFFTNHKVPYLSRLNAMILENDNKEIIRIFYYKKEEDING